ncbi:cytochrome b/b6 domain-containing protein [Aliiroseovarius lamellibrachiae]|uniref:cytochrome b/b6 domain-containing protein n=1 Tax=Aliiroseovarius lamellibrachiae TaxID=1924933 RepID=UPI001BE024D2|nr:cytochrome b/b6 domain-containing protein [Aliiroseovarius lamellibrachiae]MBT2129525.1 cytochrome b/b6 domain-containing protein [Aliiroseovarius lamellibrachiae]
MKQQDDELPEGVSRVRIWDPALRVFHWALAAAVIVTWGLGKFGPAIMTLHMYLGYAVIGLLAFRLIWGGVGPNPARFSHFLFGPKKTLAYAATLPKRRPSYWPGHNPIGALSVFGLLAILGAQVATGLISDPDDFLNVGPLAKYVSFETARLANGWHHRLSLVVLLLVGLHIAAILYYRFWKREDLVTPMITGQKAVREADVRAPQNTPPTSPSA